MQWHKYDVRLHSFYEKRTQLRASVFPQENGSENILCNSRHLQHLCTARAVWGIRDPSHSQLYVYVDGCKMKMCVMGKIIYLTYKLRNTIPTELLKIFLLLMSVC